jgi:hypothetical protein
VSKKDWGAIQAIGALLALAVTLHLVTGRRATQVHAIAGALSAAAIIGPELLG